MGEQRKDLLEKVTGLSQIRYGACNDCFSYKGFDFLPKLMVCERDKTPRGKKLRSQKGSFPYSDEPHILVKWAF